MSAKKNENCGKINEQVQEQPLRIDFCFGALYWLRIIRDRYYATALLLSR